MLTTTLKMASSYGTALIISRNSFITPLAFTDIDQNGYALFPVATINGYTIPQIGHHYKQSKKKNL